MVITAEPGSLELDWTIRAKSVDELFGSIEQSPEDFKSTLSSTIIRSITSPFVDTGERIGEALADQAFKDSYEIEVEVQPGRLERIESQIEGAVSDIAGNAGVETQLLLDQVSDLNPDFNLASINETTDTPVGGTGSGSESWNFTPITIPVPSEESVIDEINDDNLPRIAVTVSTPRLIRGLGDNQETVRVSIPPEAFIREESFEVTCETQFSDIISEIDRLQAGVSGAERGSNSAYTNITDYATEILNRVGERTSGSPEQLAKRLDNILYANVAASGNQRLQEINTEVQQIQDYVSKASQFENARNSLQQKIDLKVGSGCTGELEQRLNQATGDIDIIRENGQGVNTLKKALERLLSDTGDIDCTSNYGGIDDKLSELEDRLGVGSSSQDISLPLDNTEILDISGSFDIVSQDIQSEFDDGDVCFSVFNSRLKAAQSKWQEIQNLDSDDVRKEVQETRDEVREAVEQLSCADVPSSITSAVSSVEGAVANFQTKDQLARVSEDRDRLLDELSEVRENVLDEVDDENPCKQQLLSRLDQAKSGVQTASLRPETAIPCDQRFEEVGSQINNLEDEVLSLEPPVTPSQIQDIASLGDQITSNIENNVPVEDPCRAEMVERVNQLTQRVQSLSEEVRVEVNADTVADNTRSDRIQQLLDSISTLRTGEDQSTTDFTEQLKETT